MASQASKSAKRHPGRSVKPSGSAMLDIVAAYDTRYPDLRSRRRFEGNGPAPPNPYGGEMRESPYPYTKVRSDPFKGEKVNTKPSRGKLTAAGVMNRKKAR